MTPWIRTVALGLVVLVLCACGAEEEELRPLPGAHRSSSDAASPPFGSQSNPDDPAASPQQPLPPVQSDVALLRPTPYQFVEVGSFVDYDVSQGGMTFWSSAGLPLEYKITLSPASRGLSVVGSRVRGVFESVGLVSVHVRATDGQGRSAENRFAIVAPAAEPGAPVLPHEPYLYADEDLDLPALFVLSGQQRYPFQDTTPLWNRVTNAGAALGRVLFYDPRLSITNTVSCGSCHHQSRGFVNPQGFGLGFNGERTSRNTMPLTNVRYNLSFDYFSDMRARTLEELALMPIEDPVEMGNVLPLLEQKLAATSFYPPLFEAAFGTPEINAERIGLAIAQFLRALVSYQSPFDRTFHCCATHELPVAGWLTEQQDQGRVLFALHCMRCHNTSVQTMYQGPSNNGLDEVFFDPGAGNGRFRPASLRNVGVSAPYMHDARFATLREVIDHYDSGVQGTPSTDHRLMVPGGLRGLPQRLHLRDEDKAALEAFLHSLTDAVFLADPRFSDPFP